ncbi:hypothetical protein BpHYR1_054402 [Brachionus plicatilis]|uniref:Uncharacterized protein n=1 Tax=Brachionus plicatilis TaxID=10195 RepID=A0A3M7P312_BRAPC|nr:hypothetical protein BpHYR1_054402 [Brachionus plicatilis]
MKKSSINIQNLARADLKNRLNAKVDFKSHFALLFFYVNQSNTMRASTIRSTIPPQYFAEKNWDFEEDNLVLYSILWAREELN